MTVTTEGRSDREPLVDNMVHSSSRTARRNRELNRRVEIFLSKPSPPPKKKKSCRHPDVIKLIRKAQVANLTNIPRERQELKCLREFIADVLSGKKRNDRFWQFDVVGGGTHGSGHGVTRRKTMLHAAEIYCAFLKGKKPTPINVSRALWHTHNRILDGIEKIDRYLRGVPSGNPMSGDPVVGHTECKFARAIARLATSTPRSVYRCYLTFIKGRFKRCNV